MGRYWPEASPSITTELPILISACMTAPSGRFMGGNFSAAPNAWRRNLITLSAPSLTRYGVTFRYPSGTLRTIAVPPFFPLLLRREFVSRGPCSGGNNPEILLLGPARAGREIAPGTNAGEAPTKNRSDRTGRHALLSPLCGVQGLSEQRNGHATHKADR